MPPVKPKCSENDSCEREEKPRRKSGQNSRRKREFTWEIEAEILRGKLGPKLFDVGNWGPKFHVENRGQNFTSEIGDKIHVGNWGRNFTWGIGAEISTWEIGAEII